MKVHFKRLAAAAAAVAMSLSLSVPAFAAGNGGDRTLTVKGDTLDNKDVYAVQMFTARATGTDSVVFDNYELADENWLDFFHAATAAGGLNMPDADADDAREYVEKLEEDKLADFADEAQAWVRSHAGDFTVITSDSEDPAVADQATFTRLQAGYYLVYPEGGSTGNDSRGTDAMLVNVPQNNNAVWNIKSTFPTVNKKVDTNITEGDNHGDATDNGSAQVGDTVTFKLETVITDLSDFDAYRLAFVDELSDGLTYVANSVKVYHLAGGTGELSDDKLLTENTHYTVTPTDGLKIELTDVLGETTGIDGIKAGDKIVVTYDATINSDAITEVDYVNNKVHLDYSNNPDGAGNGTSTPDESNVYIYDFTIDKYTMVPSEEQEGEEKKVNLSGAVFELKKEKNESAEAIQLIAVSGQGNTYRVATPDEIKTGTGVVTQVTTLDNGQITIDGLEAGTYYLYEVTAPTGYNKLVNPIEVTIDVTKGYDNAVITVDGIENAEGNTTVGVLNKKGIALPETGSIGTIGLTVAGVVIVAIGLFAMPRKKKDQD